MRRLPKQLGLSLALAVVVCLGGLIGGARHATAGEVVLKNGIVLEGKPVPIQGLTDDAIRPSRLPTKSYPILLVDTGWKRYFVPARQVAEVHQAADLSRYEVFHLKQRTTGRKYMVQSLGSTTRATPFDEFGRRRITVTTPQGPIDIVQGVTKITPKYLTVTGLTHVWEHGLATTSVPPRDLDRMLRTATDQQNPDDRLAIARFYLQAGVYRQAAAELESIKTDFPELESRIEDMTLELRDLQAKELLRELKHRRDAGQHELAMTAAKLFPVKEMSPAVLREVRELEADYEQSRRKVERAVLLLGELQAQLKDPERVSAVAPLRTLVSEQLDFESLPRLDAFLSLSEDNSLSADEKLALAYSGWVLGSANAITDFDAAVRLWNARFLILEYLRTTDLFNTENLERQRLLSELENLEGIGPARVVELIPNLPLPLETPDAKPGVVLPLEVPMKAESTEQRAEPEASATAQPPSRSASDGNAASSAVGSGPSPLRYSALLPHEYTPHHRYPMIVALKPAERTVEEMLTWWGGTLEQPGQSQRRGYIVIAPEYAPPKQTQYDYGATAHFAVLQSIRDARKRFNVDSDRIFLAGHGMGGDAAFDIGMSHPDVFAGVISVDGICDAVCKWYWDNAPNLPWYVVSGELDRDLLSRNASVLNRMMRHGQDVIYTEYIGRGYESYYAEIHNLFDWMDLHRRTRFPREIEVKVLRPTENRFFWLQADGFPPSVAQATVLTGDPSFRVSPMLFQAKITEGNSVYITKSTAARHTVWLSPELIDFNQRIAVRVKGRQRFNEFVKPDVVTLLEDLRRRGDRQELYTVKLDLP